MDPLFPEVPQDLSKLSADELEQLRADSLAAKDKIMAEDAEFLGDRSGAQIIAEFQAGVEELERVKDQLAVIAEAEAAYAATKDELNTRAEAAAPEPVAEVEAEGEGDAGEGDEEEPVAPVAPIAPVAPVAPVAPIAPVEEPKAAEAVEEPEELPIAAAATVVRRPLPAASRRHKPVASEPEGTAFVASAGLGAVGTGARLDRLELARVMQEEFRASVATPPGFRQDVKVARAEYPFPEEQILRGDSGDAEKLAAFEPQALAASGALCAPATPIYTVLTFATDDRPVRDSLPGFQATRGAVSIAPPPLLTEVAGSSGIITGAQMDAGGSPAVKTCLSFTCPSFVETEVASIYHCATYDNLGARTWPERVAALNDDIRAGQSRLAETFLLDQIFDTLDTNARVKKVTAGAVNGAVNTLIGHILEAAAGIRSHHRLPLAARFRAIIPAWALDMLVTDIVRGQFDRFSRDKAGVNALLATYGIDAVFTLDGPTGSGMVFNDQNDDAALLTFPTTLLWALYPEGTWLHLDAGSLDLGIVRDSILNATNDYQAFGETWENVAMQGLVSYAITSTICPNGAVAAPSTAITC